MSEKPNGWELASSGLFTGEPDGLKADVDRLIQNAKKVPRAVPDGDGIRINAGEVC